MTKLNPLYLLVFLALGISSCGGDDDVEIDTTFIPIEQERMLTADFNALDVLFSTGGDVNDIVRLDPNIPNEDVVNDVIPLDRLIFDLNLQGAPDDYRINIVELTGKTPADQLVIDAIENAYLVDEESDITESVSLGMDFFTVTTGIIFPAALPDNLEFDYNLIFQLVRPGGEFSEEFRIDPKIRTFRRRPARSTN
ncbi:MAG: hypothetical protein WBA16_00520 [Nonlabens sp.]